VELSIGPHRFVVVSDPATSLELASEGRDGDSDLRRLKIRVRHDLPESLWRETLLHEVIHMCLALTHLSPRFEGDAEEDLVRALTPYLAMVLEDVAKARRPKG
jgi:hypothetical protein